MPPASRQSNLNNVYVHVNGLAGAKITRKPWF